jgi:hypothetical protein
MARPFTPLISALAVLLTACASQSWTQETDTTRPAGVAREHTLVTPADGEFFELRTRREHDGYEFRRRVQADREGRLTLSFLPAALQGLYYGAPLTIEVRDGAGGPVIYTRTLDEAACRDVVRQWHAQARLGARPALHHPQVDLLERLARQAQDRELTGQLTEIRRVLRVLEPYERHP